MRLSDSERASSAGRTLARQSGALTAKLVIFRMKAKNDDVSESCMLSGAREDIKLFMKLPAKFKVPTPVGEYNPDWAILKHAYGEDRIYTIRETKGTSQGALLRPTEVAKIKRGKKHFAAIGVDHFAKSSPENWNL